MKTRKILALILAVLMVLGTMPLTLLAVSADGTAISAPETLPDGETYIGTEFLLDSYDILADYQAKKGVEGATDVTNMGWIGANLLGAGANGAFRNGAEGIMFKIDATNATVASDSLSLVIVIQVSYKGADGKAISTYIVSTPQMAANYSEGICPADATSTWYYSLDGKTWQDTTVTKGTSRHTVPVGKGVAYVFVPMESFWTKCGETFLKTGAHAEYTEDNKPKATENVVNWNDAKALFGNDFEFKMTNYYYTGDFGENKTLAQDPATKISNWRVVTHGTPGTNPGALPSKLPTAEGVFYNDQIMDGFTITGDTGNGYNGWWYASDKGCTNKIVISDRTSWATSEGVMFKVDTSKVAGNEVFQMTIEFSISSSIGSTYLVASPNLAIGGYKAQLPDGSTSITNTWYFSTDGVNWSETTHSSTDASIVSTLTGERTVGYVFIPMDQLWSKAVALKEGGDAEGGKALNCVQAIEILGANNTEVRLGDMKIRLQKAAMDANFIISEIGFVHMGEDPDAGVPEGGSETPPEKLPDANDVYSGVEFYKDSFDLMTWYQQKQGSSWISGGYIGDKASALLRDGAEGILFKIDSSDATAAGDIFSMTFAFQIMFKVGEKTCNTYIVSTPKQAAAFAEAICPAGTQSTWYYSQNGKTWTTLDASTNQVSVPAGKGITYVFIPMESFWFKCGETFLKTGAHAEYTEDNKPKATENIVNWNDGKEFLGEDYYINMSNYYFGGNFTSNVTVAQDPATKLSNWRIVKTGEGYGAITPPAGADSAPTTLPTTGKEYEGDEIAPGFTANGNDNAEKPWSGVWYGGNKANKFDLSGVSADWMYSEGLMFKFDNKNAAAGTDMLSLLVEMSISSDKGTTYLLSDPNMVAGYGKTNSGDNRVLPAGLSNTATSTWYYSLDGKTWQSVTRGIESGVSNTVVSITNMRTTGYIFIPLDQFWCYGITSDGFADGQGMSAREAINILGDKTKIGDVKIRFANNEASGTANTKLSEFRFVKSTSYIIGESVFVTNDMNLNLFVSIPDGYTNDSMTFQMGNKTVTPKAKALAGNVVKYTFEDISFADISTEITATWTAKDASGVTKTQVYKTSMESYLRTLVTHKGGAQVFEELTKAMLYYGAAAQKVAGFTGTPCNEGVAAPMSMQSSSSIRYDVYLNPNTNIWGTPEVAIKDGALTIKIKVTPPSAEYTHVRYQTNGRTATTEIKDGYAYIPVCAYETRDTITMNYYKKGKANNDNTMGVSFNYVLKQAVAGASDDEKAICDALLTFANEARVYKR